MENNPFIADKEDANQQQRDDCDDDVLASLPKEKAWVGTHDLYLYQGCWYPAMLIRGVMSVQRHFQALDTDIILITMPKSGTTWLKALTFSIVNRGRYPVTLSQHHPLLTSNPHDLVPFLEVNANKVGCHVHRLPNFSNFQSPPTASIFATHIPHHSLPESIKNSSCRIIYLCRNPYNTFVSAWHFLNKVRPENLEPISCNDAFDTYCKGVSGFGPFWNNILGYWKASFERPHKVLFLMYEDLKEDIILQMKRLAEFMGVPFSLEEEREGVIEEIARLCNFDNLRDLEVNKTGALKTGTILQFENKTFFRRGEVGDWANHLTPEMVERLNKVIEEKLGGHGLAFKTGL